MNSFLFSVFFFKSYEIERNKISERKRKEKKNKNRTTMRRLFSIKQMDKKQIGIQLPIFSPSLFKILCLFPTNKEYRVSTDHRYEFIPQVTS